MCLCWVKTAHTDYIARIWFSYMSFNGSHSCCNRNSTVGLLNKELGVCVRVRACMYLYVCESMRALKAELFFMHLMLFCRVMAARSVCV